MTSALGYKCPHRDVMNMWLKTETRVGRAKGRFLTTPDSQGVQVEYRKTWLQNQLLVLDIYTDASGEWRHQYLLRYFSMTFTVCKMQVCLLNAVCFLALKKITQKGKNLRAINESGKGRAWRGKSFPFAVPSGEKKPTGGKQNKTKKKATADMKRKSKQGKS